MTTKFRSALFLSLLILPAAWTTGEAQQLRDAFRKVSRSVVIVRTKQVDLAPLPGQVVSVVVPQMTLGPRPAGEAAARCHPLGRARLIADRQPRVPVTRQR